MVPGQHCSEYRNDLLQSIPQLPEVISGTRSRHPAPKKNARVPYGARAQILWRRCRRQLATLGEHAQPVVDVAWRRCHANGRKIGERRVVGCLFISGLRQPPAADRLSRLRAFLIPLFETVGIAVEVLGRKLQELGVFQSLHLMHQAYRDIHALARTQLELFNLLVAV